MRALDLFCGGGGAGMGLHLAGFEVVGVDIIDQPDYPFDIIKADCYNLPFKRFKEFDLIWASPPCQCYIPANQGRNHIPGKHIDTIPPIRKILKETGIPFVIENVPGSPLRKDLVLTGNMFSLKVLRKRIFEIHGFRVEQPRIPRLGGSVYKGTLIVAYAGGDGIGGYGTNQHKRREMREYMKKRVRRPELKELQEAIGINWMAKRSILQAVPPVYSKYIGSALLTSVGKT